MMTSRCSSASRNPIRVPSPPLEWQRRSTGFLSCAAEESLASAAPGELLPREAKNLTGGRIFFFARWQKDRAEEVTGRSGCRFWLGRLAAGSPEARPPGTLHG